MESSPDAGTKIPWKWVVRCVARGEKVHEAIEMMRLCSQGFEMQIVERHTSLIHGSIVKKEENRSPFCD